MRLRTISIWKNQRFLVMRKNVLRGNLQTQRIFTGKLSFDVIYINQLITKNSYLNSECIPFDVLTTDENYRYGYYSFDNGKTKIAMNDTLSKELILPNGSYEVLFYAKDYFNLEATKKVSFIVGRPTGIDDTSNPNKVTAFPNSATGLTTLVYPKAGSAIIKLFDAAGSLLQQIIDEDENGETVVEVSSFTS